VIFLTLTSYASERLFGANCEQIREEAVNAGLITNKKVDQVLTLLDDPDFAIGSHIMFTAWGRRPSSKSAAGSSEHFWMRAPTSLPNVVPINGRYALRW